MRRPAPRRQPDSPSCRHPANLARTLLAGFLLLILAACSWVVLPPTPAPPPEPLVPTPVARAVAPAARPAPAATANAAPAVAVTPPPLAEPGSLRWRSGVGVPDGQSPLIYAWTQPRPGWYLNWSSGFTETVWITETLDAGIAFHTPPDADAGMEFAPMVHTSGGELQPPAAWIAAAAAARPGRTWLIGNEPDVRWQDNATPEAYARAYHVAYHAIKQADPTAQVAIAGLSQITPLRLEYLDRVWDFYAQTYGEEMPVDVWNMHAFVLQEKANDWGVDMPPGFKDVGQGMRWGIEDHDDLRLVEEQVRRMRSWMAEHGQRDKPLWITEYGILMPAAYGFDEERVRRFLLASNDLFAGLRDPELGLTRRMMTVWCSAGCGSAPVMTSTRPAISSPATDSRPA